MFVYLRTTIISSYVCEQQMQEENRIIPIIDLPVYPLLEDFKKLVQCRRRP